MPEKELLEVRARMHEPSLDDQARRQKHEELRILKHAALHTLQEDLFQYVLERSIRHGNRLV